MQNKSKPEWIPENAGNEFTTSIIPGINEINHKSKSGTITKNLSIDDYVNGVLEGNITVLSKAITLIESNASKHYHLAQEVLKKLLPYTGHSIRIGVTGSPGVGKSTLIESLGLKLIQNGLKVAVLAIDPSSTITHGSILGDKTRMESLSQETKAFIRPSPSSGTLGGVTRKTRETLLLCEAAGYDVILIETVGVGQSETTVRSMVDFFILLLLPESGDELQGIKKGVVELADLLVVNKAEAHNKMRAELTQRAYANALSLLQSATKGWTTKVLTCSAVEETGIWEIWSAVNEFREFTEDSGIFQERRQNQLLDWVDSMLSDGLQRMFFENPSVKSKYKNFKEAVLKGNMTPSQSVNDLLEIFKKTK